MVLEFPIIFQAFITMWSSIGIKKTIKIIGEFPAMILTPAFSYWVFGPISSYSTSNWCCGGNNKLGVSFFHTWINVGITILGQFFCAFIFFGNEPSNVKFLKTYTLVLTISVPSHLISIIMLALIQTLDRSKSCPSSFCNSVTQRTLLNVDDPTKQIFFGQQNRTENELDSKNDLSLPVKTSQSV